MPSSWKKNWKKSEGPRTNLLEQYNDTAQQVAAKLRASKRILIGTHEHPDGDAAGSTLALLHVLAMQGKEVVAYVPDSPPEFFAFLPAIERLTTVKPDVSSFDTVVLLDYTQMYRTHLQEEAKDHPNTIAIDHHHDNLREAKLNLIVPEAAATAHILYELFQETGTPLTKDVATCLLTGIFTDTGSFMHDSVTPDILEIASYLMGKGARLSHIAHETYQKKNLQALHIWGRAFSRIMISQETGAAVSVITHADLAECGATLDDLSGVVNMLNTLPDTKFAMLLVEYEPGKIKGSLRSEPNKGTDVSKIARTLGGGGHVLAAGFEVPGTLVQQNGHWRIVQSGQVDELNK